jgi:hypothetical protein
MMPLGYGEEAGQGYLQREGGGRDEEDSQEHRRRNP